jgi:outer membrane protein assembly factor BamB
MLFSRIRIASALSLTLLPIGWLQAEDWPTFRGKNRTAIAPDTNLLESWPESGPTLLWKTAGAGRGYSSTTVADGKIFVLGDAKDGNEQLTCFDQMTGKKKWSTESGGAWDKGQPDWQGSRSTPTYDNGRVYTVNANGNLVCCDANTGKQIWHKHLMTDFGGKKDDSWGYSESVLIDGDLLLCTPGGEEATVVALKKSDGEVVWKCKRPGDRGAGHSSIVISNVGGNKVYVQVTGSGPMGISAKDGKLLWVFEIDKTTSVIPTAMIKDDMVFFSVGYKRGGALLKQTPGAGGAVTVEPQYSLNTKLSNKHGGVLMIGDHVYGDSDDAGMPFCAEWKTGKEVWRERGSGKGSAAFASSDSMLYILFANGTMVLAKADPSGYSEVSKFSIPKDSRRPAWAHPVIVDGKLYIRADDEVMCYDITAK